MRKFLAITICFFLFFSVFVALIYLDSHGVQIQTGLSLTHKDHCHISYLFQGTKKGSLKSCSSLGLNSNNFYLAKIRFLNLDTILDWYQNSDSTDQFLAVVQIE